MKVVFDSNVLISGYLFGGKPKIMIEYVKNKNLFLYSSKETIREFKRVLKYEKFKLKNSEINNIIKDYISISQCIKIANNINLIKEDITDNVFLSLAIESKSDYIISGDRHILSVKNNFHIPILTVSEFIDIIME